MGIFCLIRIDTDFYGFSADAGFGDFFRWDGWLEGAGAYGA